MSRVGKKPIDIPKDVKVDIKDGTVEVQGPKGKLTTTVPTGVTLKVEDGKLVAERAGNEHTAMHGTVRALVANAVAGVSKGFTQEMDVVGVGYKAEVRGRAIVFTLGYSHSIEFVLPEGVSAKAEKVQAKTVAIKQYQTTVTLAGIDKHELGQVAANIHKLRKPDAYKGKGVRYADRPMKLKPGKTGK